jgi:hypothetical protein
VLRMSRHICLLLVRCQTRGLAEMNLTFVFNLKFSLESNPRLFRMCRITGKDRAMSDTTTTAFLRLARKSSP